MVSRFTAKRPDAPTSRHMFFFSIPYLAASFDLVENFFHLAFLENSLPVAQPWVALAAGFANAKWLLAAATLAACAVYALGNARRAAREKAAALSAAEDACNRN
ncbi:MAG: hypothetical protein JRI97_09715 [Deltaproteobacteria bacterium]|nr:hypothetical protein [Deltaproteobacteria bacterium]